MKNTSPYGAGGLASRKPEKNIGKSRTGGFSGSYG